MYFATTNTKRMLQIVGVSEENLTNLFLIQKEYSNQHNHI